MPGKQLENWRAERDFFEIHGGEEFLEKRAVRVHRNDLLGW